VLESVTVETFLPHEGSDFEVRDSGEPIVLRLTEVRSLGHQPHAPRVDPFALGFNGPSQPILEQRIYRLTHPVLGELEIFLVPIGIDPAGGLRYEAVFN
jgi:Domain of unknown function (DUF6916)